MYQNIIIIVVIITLILIFHYRMKPPSKEEKKQLEHYEEFDMGNNTSESDIPRIIWTYWDECPPAFIMGCIKSWIDKCPDHEVIVLTNKTYTKYINKIIDNNMFDFHQRKSDFIRTTILATYGGIWMDASIICTESLSWVHTIQKNKGVEYIGYYLSDFTSNEKYPVIENWFMACKPNSLFLKDVLAELNNALTYPHISEYLKYITDIGVNVDVQLINTNMLEYLWMHIAIQKVLQSNPEDKYKYHVLDAATSAFMYLKQNNWKSDIAVNELSKGKFKQPIIKLRSTERKYLLENDKLANKVFQAFGIHDYQRTIGVDRCLIENDNKEIILNIGE